MSVEQRNEIAEKQRLINSNTYRSIEFDRYAQEITPKHQLHFVFSLLIITIIFWNMYRSSRYVVVGGDDKKIITFDLQTQKPVSGW